MNNTNIIVDNCPICLDTCSNPVNICKNKHVSCTKCIKLWIQSSNTCPVCRSSMVITGKYNPEKHKLQHRFDDSHTWENYSESDNSRILSIINLSISGGSYTFQAAGNGPSFKIYWGDNVSNNILLKFDIEGRISWCYNKQIDELRKWKENQYKYGFEKGIIVQRNQFHTGMRLVRIKTC